jgi:hypothetical protein
MSTTTFFTETPAQRLFSTTAFHGGYRFLLYGGGIRSGKTALMLILIQTLALIFPRSRWAIVRKDYPSLRRNVLPSFDRFRFRGFTEPINFASWSASCRNGSVILFVPESIDSDPDLDAWKGLEVNGFVLEEADELSRKSWHKAQERAGSWQVPNGKQPPPYIFLTCNPSLGWVKEVFYDPWKRGTLDAPYYFQPATIADNPHISDEYRESLRSLPEREYRRFVLGDWDALASSPGALWTPETIIDHRVSDPPPLVRVVVAIDPAATSHATSDETGIVAVGIDAAKHGYVLADISGRYKPHEWASRAIGLYHDLKADRIVAEVNNGGEMVENTLRVVDRTISYKEVSATRGKVRRAEPVAAMYQRGLMHHVGTFPELEAQMTQWTPEDSTISPDRMDALVWAATALLVHQRAVFMA